MIMGKKTYFSNYQKAIMEEGNQRESQILKCIKKYTDKDAIEFKETYINDDIKFSANFDAINWNIRTIYEIKWTKYADDINYLTKQYEPQIIAQQLAMFLYKEHNITFGPGVYKESNEYDHKLVACKINPENNKLVYKVYDFPFNLDKTQELYKKIKLYWKEYDNTLYARFIEWAEENGYTEQNDNTFLHEDDNNYKAMFLYEDLKKEFLEEIRKSKVW